ncbi:terpenoid cyclases/protein prenyltransferase alpha-alpha toroid [Dichotomopilus funicola]|uniref:Protein farnesyltransferase subunit beta n=1 Tax=Dichotomopilus funicola TaxID=1934379 RepID=A0AAN6VAV1_9PEZI|nr:terpenoid cyclases/protein prenyltransferase alpha-alpha toroid [Dichotomopilus funicola]
MAAAGPRTSTPQRRRPAPAISSPSSKIREIEEDEGEEETDKVVDFSHARTMAEPVIPDLFTQLPPVREGYLTDTLDVQLETARECMKFLDGLNTREPLVTRNEHGVPKLARDRHVRFLHMALGNLPGGFLVADASRPWFLYWSLSALVMLGQDVTSYRDGLIVTARSMQNDTGGFGGGGRQLSHLATTYAVVLSLALVGGGEAYDVIDRKAMWKWLNSLKQPDGGFQVCLGGEEDIRGAYCASVIITLLRLPLDLSPESPAYTGDSNANLFTGVADYVSRCQTFEGGISGQPNVEAHGAYAFCALGCLAILDHPSRSIPRYLDVPRLVSWLSSRQYAPEGGFSGRTNKLVDGCYSHWVGGCFPLIEACLNGNPPSDRHRPGDGDGGVGRVGGGGALAADGPAATATTTTTATATATTASSSGRGGRLPPAEDGLFHREGLIRYILCCCQDTTKRGGLRDKPGKGSDAYHSCYVLSGLSSAQHQWELDDEPRPPLAESPAETKDAETSKIPSDQDIDPEAHLEAVWAVLPYLDGPRVFDNDDCVRPIHPIYAIPQGSVRAIRAYFGEKGQGVVL